MRLIFTGIGVSAALMLVNVSTSLASGSPPPQSSGGKTILGLPHGTHVKASSTGEFYIQAGTFKSKHNAEHYKSSLIKKYPHPAMIKKQGPYYVVLMGPIHSAAEVKALNNAGGRVVPVKNEVTRTLVKPNHPQHAHVVREAVITPVQSANHFEVMGAAGVANLSAEDGYLGVTRSETDRLVQTNGNDWDTFSGQLGVGYVYYLQEAQQYSETTQWFPWIEPEINGYYLGNKDLKGDVWRFGSPLFNDMTYTMPVESYRLMFDTALTLVSKRQYSLYAIGGIGNAWNRVGYSDADRNGIPCADQFLDLGAVTRSSFAWEAGAGLSYAFNSRFSLSLQYLYADLGNIKISDSGFTGAITYPVITSNDFKLTSQSASVGLHVTV